MDTGLSQYKELFVETGKEYLKSLSDSLLKLEKDPKNKDAVAEIFRASHSLKGQSAAMGFEKTGYLCHAVEDVFFEIKEGRLETTPELADLLFTAFDDLGKSIEQIDQDGTEMDLSQQAEALKKLTGVQTTGAGKTIRDDSKKPATPEPKTPEAPKETAKPDEDKATVAPEPTDTKTDTPTSPAASQKIKTIPVKVGQLDSMLNLLEELIVHQLVLKRLVREIDNIELTNYENLTDKITAALQFQIMSVRAVPVKMIFDHFPRAVRDLARIEEKEIELVVEGEELELDRTIVERLDEPLTHLIRNAASHGIGKKGTIRLSARREKGYAVVEVADDGLGVDWEAVAKKANTDSRDPAVLKKLLFSGISTAKEVTQVSGRGVGLEVVKKTVEEFGGSIDVTSEAGKGTSFILKLPLTLAVMKALLVRVGEERYAITVGLISRSLRLPLESVKKVANQEVFVIEETEIPLIRLVDKFYPAKENPAVAPEAIPSAPAKPLVVVVVMFRDEQLGLVVDEIIETSEMIIKPVPPVMKGNLAFSGVTILSDGRSALILNPEGLL
jgi:two-component system chemotaxis sensor kinase CheA